MALHLPGSDSLKSLGRKVRRRVGTRLARELEALQPRYERHWIEAFTLSGRDGPLEALESVAAYVKEIPVDGIPLRKSLADYIGNDTQPLPPTVDREGYHDERHYEFWLS